METVVVGDFRLQVVAQRHARLRHRLNPDDLTKIMSMDYGAESYKFLGILIPDLLEKVPLYVWEGYASPEAMEQGEYDEAADQSPTTAEIVNAFETALRVSGVTKLGKILDIAKLGAQVQSANPSTPTPSSPSSPGKNGASTSTDIGAKSPTSESSED